MKKLHLAANLSLPVKAVAPWNPRIVEWLAHYQDDGHVHPYTCGECREILIPTAAGWKCPLRVYRQDRATVPSDLLNQST